MYHSIARAHHPHKYEGSSSKREKYSECAVFTSKYASYSFQNSGLLMEYSGKIVNFGGFLEQPGKFI
jgi:hypothetical protein